MAFNNKLGTALDNAYGIAGLPSTHGVADALKFARGYYGDLATIHDASGNYRKAALARLKKLGITGQQFSPFFGG